MTNDNEKNAPSPGEMLTPLFFGTGDVLTWDNQTLLDDIDREKLFREYWVTGPIGPEEFERNRLTEYDPAFELLYKKIAENRTFDARGYCAYFPVFVEGRSVFVLDGMDFHTILGSIDFKDGETGAAIPDYLRAEGDIIGFHTATLGPGTEKLFREVENAGGEIDLGRYLEGICRDLMRTVTRRLGIEVRRGLSLQATHGKSFPINDQMTTRASRRFVYDLLCVEDRLAIDMDESGSLRPQFSEMSVFVHNREVQKVGKK